VSFRTSSSSLPRRCAKCPGLELGDAEGGSPTKHGVSMYEDVKKMSKLLGGINRWDVKMEIISLSVYIYYIYNRNI
jgi:hypothetical protein